MSLASVFWPMQFGQHRCARCGVWDDASRLIPDVNVEGSLIGWHHSDCPEDAA